MVGEDGKTATIQHVLEVSDAQVTGKKLPVKSRVLLLSSVHGSSVARRLAVIKSYVDKVSWDEAKSFLHYKWCQRKEKQFFHSLRRRTSPPAKI